MIDKDRGASSLLICSDSVLLLFVCFVAHFDWILFLCLISHPTWRNVTKRRLVKTSCGEGRSSSDVVFSGYRWFLDAASGNSLKACRGTWTSLFLKNNPVNGVTEEGEDRSGQENIRWLGNGGFTACGMDDNMERDGEKNMMMDGLQADPPRGKNTVWPMDSEDQH